MPKAKTTNSEIAKIEQKLKQAFPNTNFELIRQTVDGISSITIGWSGTLEQWEILNQLNEFDLCITFWRNDVYRIV